MTESEKLDVIKKRQDIGLDSLVDSVMRDNPEFTKQQAEDKAIEILKQKAIEARLNMIDKFKKQPPQLNQDNQMPMDNNNNDMMMNDNNMQDMMGD